jgi:hypothetical protein
MQEISMFLKYKKSWGVSLLKKSLDTSLGCSDITRVILNSKGIELPVCWNYIRKDVMK